MPIKHAIWKVGSQPVQLVAGQLPSEQLLEDMIVRDPNILSSAWMLIGRQEVTAYGGKLDLLAITPDGSLVVIELKRDRTPREIAAQAIDYASWVATLGADKISQIYKRFTNGGNLNEDFKKRFGRDLDDNQLNQSHEITIVAAELDDATERIVRYLNEREIAINVLFFQVFQHGGELLLSRAWLIDPTETQVNVAVTSKASGAKEPWNGEYYVSFGGDENRDWAEAVKYGFISGGGGSWYSNTLKLLDADDRVWVNIPGTGYVGVGKVTGPRVAIDDFLADDGNGNSVPIMTLPLKVAKATKYADSPEEAEYMVPVEWIKTVAANQAAKEAGFFGNQNTVARPQAPSWSFTVGRLKERWGIR
jgi:hypothetical protein